MKNRQDAFFSKATVSSDILTMHRNIPGPGTGVKLAIGPEA
jgi:hypothetical protein